MVLDALWWFDVAAKVLGRDRGVSVGGAEAGHNINLRSQPGLLKLVSRPGWFGWAEGRSRHGFDVATWLSCLGGRDLERMLRPSLELGRGERS